MNKWLRRIMEGLVFSVFAFVIVSILYKLLHEREDWLYRTLVQSLPYLVGIPLKYYLIVDKKQRPWQANVFSIIAVGLITHFITGVCLSLEDYWWHTMYITWCYGWAMFIIQVDENEDKEQVPNKEKDTCGKNVVV